MLNLWTVQVLFTYPIKLTQECRRWCTVDERKKTTVPLSASRHSFFSWCCVAFRWPNLASNYVDIDDDTSKASHMNYDQIAATKCVIIRIVSNFSLISRWIYRLPKWMASKNEIDRKKKFAKTTGKMVDEAWKNCVRIFFSVWIIINLCLTLTDWLVIKPRTQHLHARAK